MSALAVQRTWMPAQVFAAAVRGDAQFRLPLLPRLIPGIVIVELSDGLLLEGAVERRVLRGSAARTLLPRLLPLIDGTRDLAGLSAALPDVAAPAVEAALALLYSCGVLDDAGDGPLPEPAPEHAALAYLARIVDSTRANRSVEGVTRRLAAAHVGLAGDADPELDEQLLACGVGRVTRSAPAPGMDLVVAAGPGLGAVDEACARLGIPWLRTALGGSTLELGPYFDRRFTACHACLEAGTSAPESEAAPAYRRMAAAMVATEVVYLIGRIGRAVTPGGLLVRDLEAWSEREHSVPRRPGCPTCLPADGEAHAAHAYEQAVAFPPRDLINPKDHQQHYKAANMELQRDAKRYPSARRVVLGADGEAGLNVATLGALLARTAGVRLQEERGKVQRWAPTGGNLGSVQAYALARDVDGLPPGAWFYDSREHGLSWVGEGGVSDAPVVVVLTAALMRVGRKYGDFAYRIVNLDAGVAVAQLSAVAEGRGLRAEVLGGVDDNALLEALGLDGDREPITAAIALSAGSGS